MALDETRRRQFFSPMVSAKTNIEVRECLTDLPIDRMASQGSGWGNCQSFIKHRVTEPEVIHNWCQNIDYPRNLPLLALEDGQVIADATLHQVSDGLEGVIITGEHVDLSTGSGAVSRRRARPPRQEPATPARQALPPPPPR